MVCLLLTFKLKQTLYLSAMKKMLLFAGILFVGCANRNELMTKLVNEKRQLTDHKNYLNTEIKTFLDKNLYDSSIAMLDKLEPVENRLKQVDFSIDSLSKIK